MVGMAGISIFYVHSCHDCDDTGDGFVFQGLVNWLVIVCLLHGTGRDWLI
jgi:hypothetical protein